MFSLAQIFAKQYTSILHASGCFSVSHTSLDQPPKNFGVLLFAGAYTLWTIAKPSACMSFGFRWASASPAPKRCLPQAVNALGLRCYGTMKAVVVAGKKARVCHDRALPRLRDDYILVKTHAVALNPTDWKHVAYGRAKDDALIGCDFAGVVEKVGPAVTKAWKAGDPICGVTHGANLVNSEDGAFAQYIVAKGDLQMRIPDHLSSEDAATLPLSAITVGQGLYQKSLGLQLPTNPIKTAEYVLINGGGTSTGGLAVQFAKL